MANYLFRGKPRKSPRLSIFWPNINMSWKGQNVACCFNVFYSFLPSGTPLGKFMTSKYNLVFILFFIYWGYSFLVVFIFVCVRTVLFLNEYHTTTHLLITEHCHTKLRTAIHDCTGSISLTGEFVWGTVWKDCVRVKKVEYCSQAVTPADPCETKPQLK